MQTVVMLARMTQQEHSRGLGSGAWRRQRSGCIGGTQACFVIVVCAKRSCLRLPPVAAWRARDAAARLD
eukprot:COSAG01_NODE_3486_length_6017_cov_8.866509_3_plen_69_part_00